MPDLLLTHGYFMFDDPKELQILKPYAPLGILYLCSHLRAQGFEVDVFDTTFSTRDVLFNHLRTEKPSVLGVYANLMTRRNVVDILRVAREAGWRTVVGGPEPGAYAQEYLEAGAECVVFGEGELTMTELLLAFRQSGTSSLANVAGIAFLDEDGALHQTPSERRSRTWIRSHGQRERPSTFSVTCAHGRMPTGKGRCHSSPRAGVPTNAVGAVIRCLE